jgi:hypothetical protein
MTVGMVGSVGRARTPGSDRSLSPGPLIVYAVWVLTLGQYRKRAA